MDKITTLKARLLSEGANPNGVAVEDFLQQQNPQKVLRGGLSSGLKVKLLDGPGNEGSCKCEVYVNFPLYSKRSVSIKVSVEDDKLVFFDGGEELGRAQVLRAPDWYNETVQGYPITSILTQHNDQLGGCAYEWCCLFDTGEQCKFCVMDRSQKKSELRDVKRKAELLLEAMSVIPRDAYRGIVLNGGMSFMKARGLEKVTPLIMDIRKKLNINTPIAMEITPPSDLDWIDKFADAGGDSLMMNLEIWDDSIRKELIPGKDKYCPKDSYFRAFERALEVLGKGKVSTCFVVGTEPKESLIKGIQKVIEYDVVPSPLCGRYFEEFVDYPFTPNANWREFLEIFISAREEMAKRGLVSTDEAGCIACGMCDIR